MTEKFDVPPAAGICADCLLENSKIHRTTRAIVVTHCRHNLTGGVYDMDTETWTLTTPCSESAFFEHMNQAADAGESMYLQAATGDMTAQ